MNAGLIPPTAPTNPAYPLDWAGAIKTFEKFWNTSKPVLLEKSVANIKRFPAIWQALKVQGARASFIYVVRSKCFYNHPDLWPELAAGMKDAVEVGDWLTQTGAQFKVVKYEDMVNDPYAMAADLLSFIPELESLDPLRTGLHSAPYVGQGDNRALSVAAYVHLRRIFATQYPGKPINSVEGIWMDKLGYTKRYFEKVPFAKGYQWTGAPIFSD